jgi:hypothetical protein
VSGEPSARAVEHAFSELTKLYHDAPHRPPRRPAPGTQRGIDHYGPFELVAAIAHGADRFMRVHHYWPSMDHPRCFSEHIFRSRYLGEFPMPSLGDKLAARARVEQRAAADLLPPLLWSGTDLGAAAEQEFPPGHYFLKANHGSGLNHRLQFPGAFAEGFEALVKKTQGWLNWEWGRSHGEWQYSCFPRKLFIESYIDFAGLEETPDDYKFYCFDGIVRVIHVDTARFTGHKRSFYTPDWRFIPVQMTHPTHDAKRPECLAEMIAIAETLSAGTGFLRVDLYTDAVSQIRFGEITLTPVNAAERFSDPSFDVALGRCFNREAAALDPVGAWLKAR